MLFRRREDRFYGAERAEHLGPKIQKSLLFLNQRRPSSLRVHAQPKRSFRKRTLDNLPYAVARQIVADAERLRRAMCRSTPAFTRWLAPHAGIYRALSVYLPRSGNSKFSERTNHLLCAYAF